MPAVEQRPLCRVPADIKRVYTSHLHKRQVDNVITSMVVEESLREAYREIKVPSAQFLHETRGEITTVAQFYALTSPMLGHLFSAYAKVES